jgi:hypothetical protein
MVEATNGMEARITWANGQTQCFAFGNGQWAMVRCP